MKPEAIKDLIKAQSEMGAALKKSTNPHFKSKYADLAAVQDACLEPLHSNGFAVLQPSGRDDAGLFVDTIFMHNTGETLSSRVYLVVDKNNMQGVGSATTYARRYGLMGLAGIAPEDDDGEAASKAPPKEQASSIPVQTAIENITAIADLNALGAYWKDLSANQRAVAHNRDVIAAKDKRKTELTLNDEIPTFEKDNK